VGFTRQIGQLSQALKIPTGSVGDNHAAQYSIAIAPYRVTFLQDDSRLIRFAYMPEHCSWLNQVEIRFGISLAAYSSAANGINNCLCVTSITAFPGRAGLPVAASCFRLAPGYPSV
jgi:hypothetical protein